ncbi:MAG: cysteine hydrolase [Acidobacteria bacterium]|nr:cysteine hydrolase [Acidobacteriota bacterium]
MPARNEDLHGFVPEKCSAALLLIDVINDMEFPGSEALAERTVPMAHRIAELKKRAKEAGIPRIYVNDNFGRWKSDFRAVIEHVLEDGVRGEEVARILRPEDDDYFVLKPKHSAFFETTLDILLTYLGVDTVILTGVAGNICILFSANDAYMRDFNVIVPKDCVASNTKDENDYALEQIRNVLKGDVRESTQLDLQSLVRRNPVKSPEP